VRVMDNFVSRFNYDYVYNYFFGKEKVTTPYEPLGASNSVSKNKDEAPAATLSQTALKKKADKSVVFFEDFSDIKDGATPAGWATDRSSSGDHPTVTTLKDFEGKWLKLKGSASPKTLVYPVS